MGWGYKGIKHQTSSQTGQVRQTGSFGGFSKVDRAILKKQSSLKGVEAAVGDKYKVNKWGGSLNTNL